MIIKIKHELAGGHVHMGMWMGTTEGALGKCGTLVMRDIEFIVFQHLLDRGAYGSKTQDQIIWERITKNE
jgi:hypothetical protein